MSKRKNKMRNLLGNELKVAIWALSINICFLVSYNGYIKNNGSYYPETPIDLAYSSYSDNSLTHYIARTTYKNGVQVVNRHSPRKIPIFEAPAYAWLMGLLWKVTGSLKMYDIQSQGEYNHNESEAGYYYHTLFGKIIQHKCDKCRQDQHWDNGNNYLELWWSKQFYRD